MWLFRPVEQIHVSHSLQSHACYIFGKKCGIRELNSTNCLLSGQGIHFCTSAAGAACQRGIGIITINTVVVVQP